MKPYYADETVTLYHVDCREVTEWLAADVLVTDPPYGIAWVQGRLGGAGGIQRRREAAARGQSIAGDESVSARDDILLRWADRPALVFGSWRLPRPEGTAHRLIWHKAGRYSAVSPHPFFPNDEEIYVIGRGWVGPPLASIITTTEQRSMEPGRIGHPTPKPLTLMERLIAKCPPGIIADPFAGSGSTLVAAKALGRTAIGVELEERYCEAAARRLSQGVLDFGDAS